MYVFSSSCRRHLQYKRAVCDKHTNMYNVKRNNDNNISYIQRIKLICLDYYRVVIPSLFIHNLSGARQE